MLPSIVPNARIMRHGYKSRFIGADVIYSPEGFYGISRSALADFKAREEGMYVCNLVRGPRGGRAGSGMSCGQLGVTR